MNNKATINDEILEYLQKACEQMTQSYQEQTGRKIRFEVAQFSNIAKNQKRDIVRELAQLYDEYVGNESYIHIPDVYQMSYNLQHYPIIVAVNEENEEIDGVTTIKYHHNVEGDIDPYHPKKDAKFYSITGIIVKQREGIGNKGLGTNMYEAATLGLQRYASEQDEKIEVLIDIDCTNIKSLYANANANANIDARELVGKGKAILTYLDGIYIVTDENGNLKEAPTFVIKEDLVPKSSEQILVSKEEKTTFVFDENETKVYESQLKEIIKKIRPETGKIQMTTMLDKGTGYVTYIPSQGKLIQIENIRVYPNGTEKVGNNRIPRNDAWKYQGPMPNIYRRETERRSEEGESR